MALEVKSRGWLLDLLLLDLVTAGLFRVLNSWRRRLRVELVKAGWRGKIGLAAIQRRLCARPVFEAWRREVASMLERPWLTSQTRRRRCGDIAERLPEGSCLGREHQLLLEGSQCLLLLEEHELLELLLLLLEGKALGCQGSKVPYLRRVGLRK